MSIDYSSFPLPKTKKIKKKKTALKRTKIRKKSKKMAKIEKNRFSIITNNLDKCYFCSREKYDLHEAFRGRNRQKSMKWGLVVPVCRICHAEASINKDFNKSLENIAKEIFIKKYGKEKFIEEFK